MARTPVRMPDELHSKISEYCFKNKISINQFLVQAAEHFYKLQTSDK